MPFPYYKRLSRGDQAIYRRSAAIPQIALPHAELLQPLMPLLAEALEAEDREAVRVASNQLCTGVTRMLGVAPVRVEVLAVRPSRGGGELHGLYTLDPPRIQVWMRTAHHKRVVAFRTYLRTLLHELLHHLDYAHLKLADSFHTEGFFQRESSLFHQLVPEARSRRRASPRSS